MSMTFTKLFSSITESTIWVEDNETRIVWITLLAMADRYGRVWGSIPGIANRARVSVEAARAAMDKFHQPDKDSRTKEHEGRRIEDIDGGWRLLTYEKHRAMRDEEAIRESKRNYINRRRAAERGVNVEDVDRCRPNAEAEAEAEAEKKKEQSAAKAAAPVKRAPKLSDDEWQAEMQRTYPSLNVREEFGKARVWLTTNAPRRTLTRSYLLNWLNRAADRKAQFSPNGSRTKSAEPAKFRDLPEADQKAWKEAALAGGRASVHGLNESDPNAIKELFDEAASECRLFHKGDWRAHTSAMRAKLQTNLS
jgi:hypothetical protein